MQASEEHANVMRIVRLRGQRPLSLDPAETALIVVDVQGTFVDPDAPFMRALEAIAPGVTRGYRRRLGATVLPNIARLVERFRTAGMPIAYTATGTRRADRADLPGWLRAFDEISHSVVGEPMWPAVGDRAWHIAPSVAATEGDSVVNKTSSGAFATTDLERILHARDVTTVVICGLTTDVCVASTAREAADRGLATIVVSDACTALSDAMHDAALDALALALAAVTHTAAVLATLPAPTHQHA